MCDSNNQIDPTATCKWLLLISRKRKPKMSFADLERGVEDGDEESSYPLTSDTERDFQSLSNRLSLQIFKINSNTAGITKLVDLLGGPKDNAQLRTRIHNLAEATRDIAKSSTDDLKTLSSWETTNRHSLLEKAKIPRDFKASVEEFQKVQRLSAERQKKSVDKARQAARSPTSPTRQQDASLFDVSQDGEQQQQLQEQEPESEQQQTQEVIPESEMAFQEALIEEREGEIRDIEAGIHELNEIFRDLGTIVHEQQSMLDNIESNVMSVANDTRGASDQLTQAHQYQRKAGKRLFCLFIIFIIVLAVVLVAILA